MFLYEELLNMFDQLHEGSEDPQIQTVVHQESNHTFECFYSFIIIYSYNHLLPLVIYVMY